MTRRRDFKRRVRSRMNATGETYTAALTGFQAVRSGHADQEPDAPAPQLDEGEPTMEPSGTSIPILPARDIPETLAFFEQLGFTVRHDEANDYAMVRRGSIELHFAATPSLDPWTSAGMAFVRLDDVDSLYQEFRGTDAVRLLPMPHPEPVREDLRARWQGGQSIARMGELKDQPWGLREFPLLDPSNNLIRFGQPLQ